MTTQDVTDFSIRSIMPTSEVLQLDIARPGFLDALIQSTRVSEVYARLRKRYDIPTIEANEPEIIKRWIARLVTPEAYAARGVDPTDQALTNAEKWSDAALAQLKEAADSDTGLYDLPLLATGDGGTAASKGIPLGYSEQSPYAWTDVQLAEARYEDATRQGGS